MVRSESNYVIVRIGRLRKDSGEDIFFRDERITEWFSVQDSVIHARGMLRDFGKCKNTGAAGECIFTLSESQATSQVF